MTQPAGLLILCHDTHLYRQHRCPLCPNSLPDLGVTLRLTFACTFTLSFNRESPSLLVLIAWFWVFVLFLCLVLLGLPFLIETLPQIAQADLVQKKPENHSMATPPDPVVPCLMKNSHAGPSRDVSAGSVV